MKRILALGILGFHAVAMLGAELKVATVDVQRVMTDYYKAQEAAKELRAREVSFRKELEALRLEGGRLLNEAEDLRRLSLDSGLHAAVREEKRKGFELKLADLRGLEVKFERLKGQRETELQEAAARNHQRVSDEVLQVTRRLGEQGGFHLILNASKANPLASDVLFARGVEDMTPRVLAALNATRPSPRDELQK